MLTVRKADEQMKAEQRVPLSQKGFQSVDQTNPARAQVSVTQDLEEGEVIQDSKL